jgi:hypothetical protein
MSVIGMLITYLPALSDVKIFLGQFKTVILLIFYTIFLILLYRLLPANIMNSYSYIITPVTMLMTVFLFYKGFTQNYVKDFNINYERIKTVILYLCFITILFVYYTCNTGGFVQYYFGPTLVLTLLLAFFSFLYVVILLTLPEKKSGANNGLSKGDFFSNFSKFSVYGSIGFVIYLIISIIGFMYLNGDLNKNPNTNMQTSTQINPVEESGAGQTQILSTSKLDSTVFNSTSNNMQPSSYIDLSFLKIGGKEYNVEIPLLTTFTNDANTNSNINLANNVLFDSNTINYNTTNSITEGFSTNISENISAKNGSITLAIIFILFTTLIFGATLIMNIFPEGAEYLATNRVNNIDNLSLFKRALLMLLGIVISGLFIAWIVYYIQSLSSESGLVSFILNISLVLVILTLLYKTFYVKTPSTHVNAKKNAFFNLLINLLLYIPCIFSVFFDSILTVMTGKKYSTITTSFLLIIIAIILFIIYIKLPSLEEKIATQGGQLVVNRPVSTTSLTPLATYTELNGNNNLKYEFGLSFWFYIDAMPPNTNLSYTTYTSILNFGDKPNISYNARENIFRVSMQIVKRLPNSSNAELPGTKTEYTDETTEKIIYDNKNVLLQKWNNIIINYSGGTLDVFLNNDLMKSVVGVVPYMTNDALSIGATNGLLGGVCNVIYFKQPLTASQMFYMYNMVKDKTPPISDNSVTTVVYKNSIISTTK